MKSIKADNKETRGVFIINFEYIQHNNSVFLLLFLNMLLHFRKDFSHFIFLTKRKKRKIIQILFHVFTAEACSGTRSNIWDRGIWVLNTPLYCTPLREKCPYSEFSCPHFSACRLNMDQKNSEYGHFFRQCTWT